MNLWCWGLLSLVCLQLVCSSTDTSCPRDKETCYSSQFCQWSAEFSQCVSSIPCALESVNTSCLVNTWGCSWKNDLCVKTKRLPKLKSQNPCNSHKFNETGCATVQVCIWSHEFRCVLRPTIVLSLADDLGYYDVGWRNPRSRTPVLDRLRSKGIDLDRHYTSRFCAPTRAMLLTGVHPWRMGLQTDLNLNPVWSLRCASGQDRELLPATLKRTGGYSTFGVGKWHLGHYRDDLIPSQRGFDRYIGYYGGGIGNSGPPDQFYSQHCACAPRGTMSCGSYGATPLNCAVLTGMVNITGNSQKLIDSSLVREGTSDLFLANRARDMILDTSPSLPLFMFLSWGAPHDPVFAQEAYMESIQRTRPAFGTDSTFYSMCKQDLNKRHVHLAMVMTLDFVHTVVIDALEEANRFDSSIFVFISDNGANSVWHTTPTTASFCESGNNYPLRGAKFSWWEGGIRTVGFVYADKFMEDSKRGKSFKSIISASDWRRTLVKASGSILPFGDDDGFDYWSPLSGQGIPSYEYRSDIPLQIWREEENYAVLFYVNNELGRPELFKLIMGYPFSGYGAGAVGKRTPLYSHSEIEQPPEMPARELTFRIQNGFSEMRECAEYCLFNLARDPQEFEELSSVNKVALRVGLDVVKKYKAQYVDVLKSGLCEKGYYALKSLDTTDFDSVEYSRQCGGWVPWLDRTGKLKSTCG